MKIGSRILLLFGLPAFFLGPTSTTAFSFEPKIPPFKDDAGKILEIPRDELGRINPWTLFLPENLSIDRYFEFIELVEDETFLESLTEEEFDIAVDFVTRMVQSSAPEAMPDLQEKYELEIEELMDDLYEEGKLSFSLNQGFDFEIQPAVCFQKPEFILCKGWAKRKAHHFSHWCSKHKAPLIIGAVTVGVVTVAVVTGGVGGSSAAAIGGALVDKSLNEGRPTKINKPGRVFVDDGHLPHPLPPSYSPVKSKILCKFPLLAFTLPSRVARDPSSRRAAPASSAQTRIRIHL